MPLDHFVDLPSCENEQQAFEVAETPDLHRRAVQERGVRRDRAGDGEGPLPGQLFRRPVSRAVPTTGWGGRDDLVRRLLFSARVFEKLW